MATDRPAAQSRSTSSRAGFRDDIQGMRALAVLAIMAFHAGFSPYAGGFVTLDVFFVISGFLITSLLLREIDRTGTLSLRRFYERRARRILPAATVATIGIVIASWTWLNLVEAEDAATDARWAALFAANIRFAMEETDYFASEEPPSPFQHYWSLSVEEQFYAVLPLLLLGCLLLAARLGRRGRHRVLAAVLGVVTVASFGWSVYASYASPETAYFSTLTRTWEFGVGALIAIAAPLIAGQFTARARNLFAAAGLAAIVIACFAFTESTPFPGYAALLPVLGTGAIMIAGAELGQRPTPVMQRALGVGPLRYIGDMSYSLYLWHWPVLVIATQHLGRELGARETMWAFAGIFALSWVSYRCVETPFRRGMPSRLGRGLVLYPLTLTVVAVGAGTTTDLVRNELDRPAPAITLADYPQPSASDRPSAESHLPPTARERRQTTDGEPPTDPSLTLVEASARAAQEGAPVPGDLEPALDELSDDKADLGDCDYSEDARQLCRRGAPDAERTLVLLGDSHGRHWIPAFEAIAERTDYAAYYLVKEQCTPARVAHTRMGDSEAWQECQDFNDWAQQQIASIEPDIVLISTTGSRKVEINGSVTSDEDAVAAELRSGFGDLISDLTPHADRVVVLGDVPQRMSDPAQCLSERDATLATCDNTEEPWGARVHAVSRQAAKSGPAEFLETRQWFCDDGVCPPVIGSTIPMRDTGHLTTAYAEHLSDPLRRALQLTPTMPERSSPTR